MKKILILLIGFAFTQSIQTKEVIITLSNEEFELLDELVEEGSDTYSLLDLSSYINLEYMSDYLLKFIKYEPINIEMGDIRLFGCPETYEGTSYHFFDEVEYVRRDIRITPECSIIKIENPDEINIGGTFTFHITGMFEDEYQNQIDDINDLLGGITSGDMNLDGIINVVDIVALVNIIIGEE
jgi:hypothetical protein